MNKTVVASGALAIALVGGGTAGYAIHGSSHPAKSASGQLSSIAARASATAHNAQDASFAQDMTEHHRQAIVMAGLASTRSTNPQVLALAKTIEGAQSPEIETMTGWLAAWGAPSTPPAANSGISGMMSMSDMSSLGALRGVAFDKMFLVMMTQHHDGAITMAQQELRGGEYGDSLALAASIVVSQQGQVQQMHQLLTA